MDPLTVNELIERVARGGGFDMTVTGQGTADILGWLNQARATAITDAAWRKVRISLGPTVAGQSEYALPANVARVLFLTVGGSNPYLRIDAESMVLVQGGAAYITEAPGAFAPDFEADGDAVVELWPTPEEAGLEVVGLGVVLPSSLVEGGAATTVGIPADLQQDILVHGAIAEGKGLVEEDSDGYTISRERYVAGVAKLKRLGNSRIGRGPHQIRIER